MNGKIQVVTVNEWLFTQAIRNQAQSVQAKVSIPASYLSQMQNLNTVYLSPDVKETLRAYGREC